MSERNLWARVRENLRPYGHMWRVENPTNPGLPDVHYIFYEQAGWLEMKYRKEWPARATTLIRPGLTPRQVAWHRTYSKAGGQSFVLLGVGKDMVLLPSEDAVAAQEGPGLDKFTLQDTMAWFSEGRITAFQWQDLARTLAERV